MLDVFVDSHREPQARSRAVAELAARQHGVVARRQLSALGVTGASVAHRVGVGQLHPLHRGVYAVGHARLSGNGQWMAAVLSCGDGALLSHRSAAALLGLRPDARARIDVTSPALGRRSHGRVTVHTARHICPVDRATCDGIPVTALPRTLLDLAAVVDPRQLERAFEAAERLRILDVGGLRELAARSHGHHGLRAFRELISRHRAVPETREELERVLIDICDAHGLPRPVCNAALEGFIVDALWPHARLVVEVDSWEFHRTRAAFERDRARDATLQLAGYTVVRITARQMRDDPKGVASTLRHLLDRA